MGLIKDVYHKNFYERFADSMEKVYPAFERKKFMKNIFTDAFPGMEWKERMLHTTHVFHQSIPSDFKKGVAVLDKLVTRLQKENTGEDMLAYIFLPEYIAIYGLNDFERAVKSLEKTTQFISAEFAVRPFLLKYGDRMMQEFVQWSLHDHHKVRRLASEGCRPRLPWAMAIPALKKNPLPIFPVLENLKNDPHEWVRRSVANNLNDIAKDHPDTVIRIAKQWKGISKETDAVIKHGCRTLLKQGHPLILKQFGLTGKNISAAGFKIITPTVKMGTHVEFTFKVRNEHTRPQLVRLEYGMYYQKSKGHLAKKVFKISERIYQPGEEATIQRKQPFKYITTRKFYPGLHQVSLIINGEEKEPHSFVLTN